MPSQYFPAVTRKPCGRWDNRVTKVPAISAAIEQWYDRYEAQAEGPQWRRLEKPSLAAALVEDDRDLPVKRIERGCSSKLQWPQSSLSALATGCRSPPIRATWN